MTTDWTVDTDTSPIRTWKSIFTLVVFIVTNVVVLFPFHIPIYVPRVAWEGFLDALASLRVIRRREHAGAKDSDDDRNNGKLKRFVRFRFPMNFVTAPLIADLLLLAIQAIGSKEVVEGILGANSIFPIDIMAFFITLAYIAISLDASGLIRYLAFKVLQWGGKKGHRLFFFLYTFFFALGSFIGNDPIILSGTAFLAYMTRVSKNIVHPRAWIFAQFAVANIASAILVSSNPTNLVLAGAFDIKFIDYTANMIIPVLFTAVVLFPFLLYIVFADESLIPAEITMHEPPPGVEHKKPVNPNIPHARGTADEAEEDLNTGEQVRQLSLEEIMNPFLDKGGAWFGAVIMGVTLVTLLGLNAAKTEIGEIAVWKVTVPAAGVMFCWDLGFGWYHRKETRQIARKGRREVELARAEKALKEEEALKEAEARRGSMEATRRERDLGSYELQQTSLGDDGQPRMQVLESNAAMLGLRADPSRDSRTSVSEKSVIGETREVSGSSDILKEQPQGLFTSPTDGDAMDAEKQAMDRRRIIEQRVEQGHPKGPTTLVSLYKSGYRWCQETFPTATAVIAHLPFALIPFAFCMFILVQGLVTKGWVPVFAYGWDHWVEKTGTVGSIGGMGFLSTILCNFAGTNIGTTILLSRVIQTWKQIHHESGVPISDRTFWATVYSMALGVNYGAFSSAFSASLAGLLWRDILARKHIRVKGIEFARVNVPIIAIAMTVGCAVLVGEVYIYRKDTPIDL